MKSLLTPGICLAAVAALLHTGLVTPSATLVGYAFYGVWIAGLLLAWRFHSSRIFFALLVLFLAQQAISYFSSHFPSSGLASLTVGTFGRGMLIPNPRSPAGDQCVEPPRRPSADCFLR